MLYYQSQNPLIIIGSATAAGTRTGTTLTSAYTGAAKATFATGSMSKLNLDIAYTTGTSETGTTLAWKVEVSPDNINWYRIQNEAVSTGTSTLSDREWQHAGGTGATTYNIALGIDIFNKYAKVSFKENSVSSNYGSLFCALTLSGK